MMIMGAVMLMFRNTVNNTWTLQWCGSDGLSRHTGDGNVHLRIAGCIYLRAALASSEK